MRMWDLNSPAVQIEDAFDRLRKARAALVDQWDDKVEQAFHEKYVAPLEPRVQRAIDAIRTMEETLAKAKRACEDEDER